MTLKGAYQIATNGDEGYVYVANNDDAFHNILVFQLTADGLVSTDFRMETGNADDDDFIFAIDVDDASDARDDARDARDAEATVFQALANHDPDVEYLLSGARRRADLSRGQRLPAGLCL